METVFPAVEPPDELPAAVELLLVLFAELLHPATRAIEMPTAAKRSAMRDNEVPFPEMGSAEIGSALQDTED